MNAGIANRTPSRRVSVFKSACRAILVSSLTAFGAVAVAGLFLAAACVFGLVNKLGLLVVFLAGMIVFGLGPLAGIAGLWLFPPGAKTG